MPSFQEFQTAAVCFISNIDDCGRFLFCNTEDLGGGGTPDNYNPDNEEHCKKDGYLISSCPDGYKHGGLTCLYIAIVVYLDGKGGGQALALKSSGNHKWGARFNTSYGLSYSGDYGTNPKEGLIEVRPVLEF